jgi:hypothetical protein
MSRQPRKDRCRKTGPRWKSSRKKTDGLFDLNLFNKNPARCLEAHGAGLNRQALMLLTIPSEGSQAATIASESVFRSPAPSAAPRSGRPSAPFEAIAANICTSKIASIAALGAAVGRCAALTCVSRRRQVLDLLL